MKTGTNKIPVQGMAKGYEVKFGKGEFGYNGNKIASFVMFIPPQVDCLMSNSNEDEGNCLLIKARMSGYEIAQHSGMKYLHYRLNKADELNRLELLKVMTDFIQILIDYGKIKKIPSIDDLNATIDQLFTEGERFKKALQ